MAAAPQVYPPPRRPGGGGDAHHNLHYGSDSAEPLHGLGTIPCICSGTKGCTSCGSRGGVAAASAAPSGSSVALLRRVVKRGQAAPCGATWSGREHGFARHKSVGGVWVSWLARHSHGVVMGRVFPVVLVGVGGGCGGWLARRKPCSLGTWVRVVGACPSQAAMSRCVVSHVTVWFPCGAPPRFRRWREWLPYARRVVAVALFGRHVLVWSSSLEHCGTDGFSGLHASVAGSATTDPALRLTTVHRALRPPPKDAAVTSQATGLPEPYSA